MDLGTFTNIVSLLSLAVSFSIWCGLRYRERFEKQLINIHIKVKNGEVYPLHGRIRRKNLTRSEVQGLLGILPMKAKQERYKLASLSQADFFRRLEEVQEDRTKNTLVVECSVEELKQFDLEKLQAICTHD